MNDKNYVAYLEAAVLSLLGARPHPNRCFMGVDSTHKPTYRFEFDPANLREEIRRHRNAAEPECPGEDCKACSGEYYYTHFNRPCDCDVSERHQNKPKERK